MTEMNNKFSRLKKNCFYFKDQNVEITKIYNKNFLPPEKFNFQAFDIIQN